MYLPIQRDFNLKWFVVGSVYSSGISPIGCGHKPSAAGEGRPGSVGTRKGIGENKPSGVT